MNKTTLYSAAFLVAYSFSSTSFAQSPQAMPMQGSMPQHMNMPMHQQNMKPPAFNSQKAAQRLSFSEFPTPDELSRMTPPEPMTEEKIKQRFEKRKARIAETIAHDRKQAEKYAKDFARFQKHQSDQLAKIMARAEKNREALLTRINKREQQVLENFRKREAARNFKPKQN